MGKKIKAVARIYYDIEIEIDSILEQPTYDDSTSYNLRCRTWARREVENALNKLDRHAVKIDNPHIENNIFMLYQLEDLNGCVWDTSHICPDGYNDKLLDKLQEFDQGVELKPPELSEEEIKWVEEQDRLDKEED